MRSLDAVAPRVPEGPSPRRRNPLSGSTVRCRVCSRGTAEHKPYCIDHLAQLPQVAAILSRDELAVVEADILAVLGEWTRLSLARLRILVNTDPTSWGLAFAKLKREGRVVTQRRKSSIRGVWKTTVVLGSS